MCSLLPDGGPTGCCFDQKQVAELNIALQFQQVVNLTSQQVGKSYMNILSFMNIDFYFYFGLRSINIEF